MTALSLEKIIEDLQDPRALPDPTEEVRVVQTHISVVLVTDRVVYKLKKPVDFGFLDFSTLEKRRYFCQREVELNRRLSRDLYLGVLPVCFDGRRFSLKAAAGEAVEFAVKMRRLPEARLMKNLFLSGSLTREDLERIARVLAGFHRAAERSPEIDRFGRPEAFKINTEENFEQVAPYVGLTIDREDLAAIRSWTEAFYRQHAPLFERRIREGRIRDGHGDLHMEHICLQNEVAIFDCIEFNDRFRYGDTLADLAFLLMDLELHDGHALARTLWKIYREESGEGEVEELLRFYKVYRAFVRGKVNGFQTRDPGIPETAKIAAVQTARRYFCLARSYVEQAPAAGSEEGS